MKNLLFVWPGNDNLAAGICEAATLEKGAFELHKFPDGESYIRLDSDVANKDVFVFIPFDHRDEKLMGLTLLCRVLKKSGAKKIGLLSPYLPYMRQDTEFRPGEAVSAEIFASFISGIADVLITIDPHLHRISRLQDIFRIPVKVLHSAVCISKYISAHIPNPVIIGPDSESSQWATEIAARIKAPHIILEKHRTGDQQVEIRIPSMQQFPEHTPVLVDDIISTAHTLAMAVEKLRQISTIKPICIGVHGLFNENAFAVLQSAGASEIITCNTIAHHTNRIDVAPLFRNLHFPL